MECVEEADNGGHMPHTLPQERCGKNMRQLSDSESDEELQDAGEAQKLSELYTWGRATNYQLGYGVSGNEQQIPKLVQLPTGAQVMSETQFQFECWSKVLSCACKKVVVVMSACVSKIHSTFASSFLMNHSFGL